MLQDECLLPAHWVENALMVVIEPAMFYSHSS